MFNSFLTTTVCLLAIIICHPVDAQDSVDKNSDSELLAYVPAAAHQVVVFRPAKIMASDDYREFTRSSDVFQKVVKRLSNQYFKFGLAKLEDVDSIVFSNCRLDGEHGRFDHHSTLILNTVDDNAEQFDLATHAVKSEFEFEGQTSFQMKKRLDGRWRFACIADDRTIIWGDSQRAIEGSIKAGEKGASKAEWFRLWLPSADDSISFAIKTEERDSLRGLGPFSQLKGIRHIAGGADLSKNLQVTIRGLCETRTHAGQVVTDAKSVLEPLQSNLNKQLTRQPEQAAGIRLLQNLIKSARFKTTDKVVEAKANVTLDLDALVQPAQAMYAASKRTEAANNLRQNALAFHNFESAFGKFPSSVMVHESGKKYSWRIAILPFIEQKDLYDKYDFTQDWNSPHNLEVTSQMPDVFRSDTDDEQTTNTSFFMLTGPGGMFGGDNPISISDIHDGTSNTIMAIEAQREVHWAKPEDIVIDPDQPLPDFGGFHDGGFNATMADGSVRFISNDVAAEVLRQLFTPRGGEVFDHSQLDPRPFDDQ